MALMYLEANPDQPSRNELMSITKEEIAILKKQIANL